MVVYQLKMVLTWNWVTKTRKGKTFFTLNHHIHKIKLYREKIIKSTENRFFKKKNRKLKKKRTGNNCDNQSKEEKKE